MICRRMGICRQRFRGRKGHSASAESRPLLHGGRDVELVHTSLLWKEALREGQMQDRLQMISLRKEVEQMSLFDAVSRCNEHRQVTG